MGTITSCLALNIRELRRRKHLTQTELAKQAGISLIFLQGIESQRKWISPATVAAIAKALEVSPSRLFEYKPEKKTETPKIKRKARPSFDHVPDDIFNALATTCKHPDWKWEVFRWIIEGYQKSKERAV